MEPAAGLVGSPFSDLPIVRSHLEPLATEPPHLTLQQHRMHLAPAPPWAPLAMDADLAIAVCDIGVELNPTPLQPQLSHPVPVPADSPAPLTMDAISSPVPCPHKSIKQDKPKSTFCKIMNRLSVAVEVRLNEGEEWHVLYPEQVKTIEYEASLDPEVFVRLREDYDIQSRIHIENVGGILNILQDFGEFFRDEAKQYIDNQDKEAEEEHRFSEKRQHAITVKVDHAINRLAHRRQGCLFLCTASFLSVVLGLLIFCTVASFGLNYDAPEQWGLGPAMVVLMYFTSTALYILRGEGDLSNRLQNNLRAMGSTLQNFNADSLNLTLTADGQWSWRRVLLNCCLGIMPLMRGFCAMVFFVGCVVRSVAAANGEIWWLIVLLFVAFLAGCCFCMGNGACDKFCPSIACELAAIAIMICGVCAMVVFVYGWFTGMPPPILGWMSLLILGLLLVCKTTDPRPKLFAAWFFDTEIEDFQASLIVPAKSTLDAAVLGVNQGTIVFEGSVLPNVPTIVSWPGKYESEWDSLVGNARQRDVSAAVVFLPEGCRDFGAHDPVPRKYYLTPPQECCQCWCHWLYGEQKPWGCRWWTRWIRNIELAVKNGNVLEVYFFDGKKGKGKVKNFTSAGEEHKRREAIFKKKHTFLESGKYGQALVDGLALLSHQKGPDSSSPFSREVHRLFLEWLPDKDRQFLEDSEGLGNSQKAEVAWLEKHRYSYIEKEVSEFSPGATTPSPQTIGRRDSEGQLLPQSMADDQV